MGRRGEKVGAASIFVEGAGLIRTFIMIWRMVDGFGGDGKC
jgi:hypothetical protein